MFGYILRLVYKSFKKISPMAFFQNAQGLFRESIRRNIRKPLRRIGLIGIAVLLLTSTAASSILQVSSVRAEVTTPEQACTVSGGIWDNTAKSCAMPVKCPSQPVEAKGGNYSPRTGGCTPSEEAISISYLSVLYNCVGANMKGVITSSIDSGRNPPVSAMFGDSIIGANEGYVYPGAKKKSCANIMTAALTLWGISDTGTLLDLMGIYTYNAHSGSGDTANPEYVQNGGGGDTFNTTRADAFKAVVKKQVYGSGEPAISDAAKYAIAYDAFTRSGKFDSNTTADDTIAQCNAHDYGIYPDALSNQPALKTAVDAGKSVANDKAGDYNFFSSVDATRTYTKLNIVGSDGTPSVHAYAYLSAKSYSNSTADIITSLPLLGLPLLLPKTGSDTLTHATTFGYRVNFVGTNPPACATLAKSVNKYAGAFQTWQTENKKTFDGTSSPTCTDGSSPDADGKCNTGATSCVVDGVGWLVCPLMNALGGLNDAMYSWIKGILVLNPLSTTAADGSATAQYTNWSIIRNIANVLLVIAFLFIIFSQISSIGISNYGVKKMLPRVILIAIAINLSWILMSLAIDAVNVIGTGLQSLLDTTAVTANTQTLNAANASTSFTTGLVTGTVGAGVAVAVGLATAGASTLVLMAVPFILGAALALFAAVATLFLRNAIVIVLVIVAPVALVAYLLPNTEEYFKKWRKMFLSMLMLFPMAALLFAGAKFAAYIIVTSDQQYAQLIALFVMAAPLGMLPWLARSSGGILATVNQGMGRMAKGLQSATQKGLASRVEAGKAERRANTRNFLGGRRDASKYKGGTGETYKKEGGHYERGADGKLHQKIHKEGDLVVDKEGKPLGAKLRRRTFGGVINDMNQGLKTRTETAQKTAVSNYQEAGLRNDGSKRAAKVAGTMDASKREGLRGESIEAAYKGRLEVAKLKSGETRQIYDRLQDANATTSALEHEQTLRQKDRLISNVANTAAGAIGLSDLAGISIEHGSNITAGSADRLNAMAEGSIDVDGGLGLKVLHENQERAEFAAGNIDATLKSKFEKSKLAGGANADLFAESLEGKAAGEFTASEQQRIENEARLGINQTTADGKKMFTQEIETDSAGKPILDANGKTIITGGQLGDIRTIDQNTQASTAASNYAAGGKGIQYAAEIDSESERGKELAVAASGAAVKDTEGNQVLDDEGNPTIDPLTLAKAAKAVIEDKASDQDAIVSLARSKSLGGKETLAFLGVDADTGQPIRGDKPKLKPAETLGYIKYAAARGDRQTTMTLLSHVSRMRKEADAATALVEDKKARGDVVTAEEQTAADTLPGLAREAQAVLLQDGGSSLPPWIGGSDKQKLAEGMFEYSTEEAAVAAVAGGKLTADAFAAMDIKNRDTFVSALTDMPDDQLASIKKKTAENLMQDEGIDMDTAMEKVNQNFAQAIIPIDKAQFDVRLNRGLAARDIERYDDMRARLAKLSEKPDGSPRTPQIIKPGQAKSTDYKKYDGSV